jgi:glucosamine-6-phosphate deaminase
LSETRHYDDLRVTTFGTNEELGAAAAEDFAAVVTAAVAERGSASVILATGNSQLTFIEAVRRRADIDWSRISVFHMDEYLGMAADHPASFRRWMREKLVRHVDLQAFYGVEGDAESVADELRRYAGLLEEHEPVLCVMGIGENGHLAFNDPPADFETTELVKVVTLDERSRKQQVGEGHFGSYEETPEHALSLTVPALLRPAHVMVLVPEARKADAVREALEGPITADCPASILRRTPHARLYLDAHSAGRLSVRNEDG